MTQSINCEVGGAVVDRNWMSATHIIQGDNLCRNAMFRIFLSTINIDALVTRLHHSRLDHSVYRKPTHTDRRLPAYSHYNFCKKCM